MPERWENELRKLRSAGPPEGLWQRAGAGPTRPEIPPGSDGRGRLVATVVSTIVVLAAGFGLWNAFGRTHVLGTIGPTSTGAHGPSAGPSSTPAGYFVTLPETVTAHTGDNGTQLTVGVPVTTNLPNDVRAFVRWTYLGGTEEGAGGLTVMPAVNDGELAIDVPWPVCDFGEGFSLGVEFRPFYEDFIVPGYPQGSPWPPAQDDQVLQLLGDHFQNVTGDQVTTVDSSQGPIRRIAVSRDYAWPDTPSDFTPPPCPSPPGPP